jgi:hypothetical protein
MGVRHMTREQKQMARRLKAKGMTLKAMARELSCSLPLVTASVYVQHPDSGLPDRWTPARGRVSAEDREEILLGWPEVSRCRPSPAALDVRRRRSPGRWPPTEDLGAMGPGRRTAGPRDRHAGPSPPSRLTLPSSNR